jgi:hypothetical protein
MGVQVLRGRNLLYHSMRRRIHSIYPSVPEPQTVVLQRRASQIAARSTASAKRRSVMDHMRKECNKTDHVPSEAAALLAAEPSLPIAVPQLPHGTSSDAHRACECSSSPPKLGSVLLGATFGRTMLHRTSRSAEAKEVLTALPKKQLTESLLRRKAGRQALGLCAGPTSPEAERQKAAKMPQLFHVRP